MDLVGRRAMDRRFDVAKPRKQCLRTIFSCGTEPRSVDERVDFRQRPMRVGFGGRTPVFLVMMSVSRILAAEPELRRTNSRALDAFGPDCFAIDRQTAERGSDLVERHTCIDERTDNHVARRTREAVEVQDLHNLSILPDATGQAAGLDERVVALLAENQVIEDIDSHDVASADQARRQREVIVAWRRIAGRVIVE